MIVQHPKHAVSLEVYAESDKRNTSCAAHSLAEAYSTVTALPGNLRMSAEQALLFLEDVYRRLNIVALNSDEYIATLNAAVGDGITGGTIYDALLAGCATKAGAEVIYTWDPGDFRRVNPAIAARVRTP